MGQSACNRRSGGAAKRAKGGARKAWDEIGQGNGGCTRERVGRGGEGERERYEGMEWVNGVGCKQQGGRQG